MTIAVQEILDRFDGLTEPEQREAAREILLRVLSGENSALSDEELTRLAKARFAEMDCAEAASGKHQSFFAVAKSLKLSGPSDWSSSLDDDR